VAAGFSDSIRKLGTCGQFFGPFLGPKLAPGRAIHLEISYQYINIFKSKSVHPIYLFCADFFKYIGGTLCDGFGGADSLSKMGANVEILSELVPTLGAVAHPFCLNGQNLFCFSEILETDKLSYYNGAQHPNCLKIQLRTSPFLPASWTYRQPAGRPREQA